MTDNEVQEQIRDWEDVTQKISALLNEQEVRVKTKALEPHLTSRDAAALVLVNNLERVNFFMEMVNIVAGELEEINEQRPSNISDIVGATCEIMGDSTRRYRNLKSVMLPRK